MTKLTFMDGMSFTVSDPPHIEHKKDGLYVVGKGFLIPCDDMEEAQRELKILKDERSNTKTTL